MSVAVQEITFSNQLREEFRVLHWPSKEKNAGHLVIHHGFGEHAGRYQTLADAFAELPLNIWSFDMRGHGKSLGKRGDSDGFEQLSNDYHQFLLWLKDQHKVEKCTLFGHSLGAAITLYYLSHQSPALEITSVILSAPPIEIKKDFIAKMKITSGYFLKKIMPTLTLDSGLPASYISSMSEEVERYLADPLVHSKVSVRFGLELVAIGEKLLQQAGRIQKPILLYHGGDDQIALIDGSRRLHQNLGTDDVTYVEYPGLRHETHHEILSERKKVFKMLKTWLKKYS